MLDYSLSTAKQRIAFINENPNAATPERMADYILNADDNQICRPESRQTYWKGRDDKAESLENLTPNTKVFKPGQNLYLSKVSQKRDPLQTYQAYEADLQKVQMQLLLQTPGTAEYSKLRHLLIQMRRDAYILADSERPIIGTRTNIPEDTYDHEADLSSIDLQNPLHIRFIYEQWATLEDCTTLDAQALKHTLLTAEQRTPLINWHRDLLAFRRQGLSYKEFKDRLDAPRTQALCTATLVKIYPQLAATIGLMELESSALKFFNPRHWRYCNHCKQWYLDIAEFWRERNKSKCKNCFAKLKNAAQGSGIFELPKGDQTHNESI